MIRQFLLTLPLVISLVSSNAQGTPSQFHYVTGGEAISGEAQAKSPAPVGTNFSMDRVLKKTGVNNDRRQERDAISFCDLVRQPNLYNQRVVRTEAIMIVGYEQSYLYDPACNSADTWSWAERGETYKSIPETEALLDSLLNQEDGQGARRARVTIVGRLDASPGKRYGHLDQFRSQFLITHIERVEQLAGNVPWPWDIKEDAPLSKAEQAVKNLNDDFILYYAGARIPRIDLDLINDDLAADFTFTAPTGEVKNKSQFIESNKSLYFAGQIINNNQKVQVSGDTAVATGHVMKTGDAGITEQFRYTSRYVKLKGRWQVLALKVTREDVAISH